jgi:site-specific recombinase XerD
VLPAGLTDRSVANIIKIRAAQAGLDEALFSGHSLRAGFLTSAAESGATLVRMMDVSRYSRVDTLLGYIRSADAFKDHAGSGFM